MQNVRASSPASGQSLRNGHAAPRCPWDVPSWISGARLRHLGCHADKTSTKWTPGPHMCAGCPIPGTLAQVATRESKCTKGPTNTHPNPTCARAQVAPPGCASGHIYESLDKYMKVWINVRILLVGRENTGLVWSFRQIIMGLFWQGNVGLLWNMPSVKQSIGIFVMKPTWQKPGKFFLRFDVIWYTWGEICGSWDELKTRISD